MDAVSPHNGVFLDAANARFSTGFPAEVGFHFLEWQEGRAVLGLNIDARHLNLANVIHGGVLATLMDVAGACAGTWNADPHSIRKAVTLSMTTTFTGQASDGLIRCIGTRRAGGSRIYNSTMEVFDEHDNLLAMGEATFRLRST
ncbi:MAG: phenylacetic acid degradation-related protein [Alcanivoracaceae bacterium]|uniref:PaaI family thioesterase n=1 Tax=Alcanivorax profundi TaxID=2338368 RepID=UPI000C68A11E|nr:phenylacetic acid degradation-related protein [Alcanivoracaceae bacterium]MCG8439724.1 PaaI family thioesterase [Pseudomonadales bacterium]